jgi:nucleoside-diphosphate-sugar epimerase
MDSFVKKICDDVFKTNNYTNFKNKNILITGANGLIGGILADFFHYLNQEKKFNINLILTSKSKSSDLIRIKHLLTEEYVTYFDYDLSTATQNIPDLPKIDYCFYSAGYATPTKFIDRPIETLNTNINGLYMFLELIMGNNPNAHFLYISSGEIYSANNNSDLYKETDIINIDLSNKRNFYKIGKITGELLINYFRDKGLKASSIRTTICYGPGVLDTDNRVLSDLTRKGINNNIVQLMDNGESTRKLLHITDFCLMVLNISQTCKYETYNVNGSDELSIFEIASIISEILNVPVEKGNELNVITKYATNSVSMSISRYEEEFGKHTFISTEEGIKNFVDWYKTILIK